MLSKFPWLVGQLDVALFQADMLVGRKHVRYHVGNLTASYFILLL